MTRAILSIFLSLLLAVTSATFAVARGQSAAVLAGVTEMVICSNGAAVSVLVDSAGNPVEPHHHCPDCLVALDLPRPAGPAPQAAPVLFAQALPQPAAEVGPVRLVLAAAPRGPPVLS